MKKTVLLFSILLQLNTAYAEENVWKLPLKVSDSNTKVKFDVDTTWHVVNGKLSNISGTIDQSDPKNPLAITAEINFPVKSIDTGWGLRNDSLYEHWEVDKFPNAVFKTTELQGDCNPQILLEKACTGKLKGSLTIRDVTKEILIDIKIEKQDDSYKASGEYTFAWADYGIKDPSIFAAKVEPNVKVKYSTTIPVK